VALAGGACEDASAHTYVDGILSLQPRIRGGSELKTFLVTTLAWCWALLGVYVSAAAADEPPTPGDPFTGNYAGTFHPRAEYPDKPKPDDKKNVKPQKCGTCHLQATVERAGQGYLLILGIEHGKQKDGQIKWDRFRVPGQRQGNKLSFVNAKYEIDVVDGKATGRRKEKMIGEIELTRQPAKK
jgi:hypothetical protein